MQMYTQIFGANKCAQGHTLPTAINMRRIEAEKRCVHTVRVDGEAERDNEEHNVKCCSPDLPKGLKKTCARYRCTRNSLVIKRGVMAPITHTFGGKTAENQDKLCDDCPAMS